MDVTQQMHGQIDTKNEYAEGCNALRLYSAGVLQMRILTVAQGIVLLTIIGLLLKNGKMTLALSAATFGILFTCLLWALQRNYWLHFSAILNRVTEIESHRASTGMYDGPWTEYSKQRRLRHSLLRWYLSAVQGPFLLLIGAFAVVIVYTVFS